MYPTLTPSTLTPAVKPTFYFIGVTTGHSSIRRVFPVWADALGLGDVEMMGIDVAIHADAADYRSVVTFIKNDPLSLGALVTTHKIDIFDAAHDLFDEIDPLATLMHEISCISKSDGRLCASAKDPISSGHALDAFIPEGHFARTGAELCIFGAGGIGDRHRLVPLSAGARRRPPRPGDRDEPIAAATGRAAGDPRAERA